MNDNFQNAAFDEQLRVALAPPQSARFRRLAVARCVRDCAIDTSRDGAPPPQQENNHVDDTIRDGLSGGDYLRGARANGPEQVTFAQAIKAVEGAQTADAATWTRTTYLRESSKDGKETWLRLNRTTIASQGPGEVIDRLVTTTRGMCVR